MYSAPPETVPNDWTGLTAINLQAWLFLEFYGCREFCGYIEWILLSWFAMWSVVLFNVQVVGGHGAKGVVTKGMTMLRSPARKLWPLLYPWMSSCAIPQYPSVAIFVVFSGRSNWFGGLWSHCRERFAVTSRHAGVPSPSKWTSST